MYWVRYTVNSVHTVYTTPSPENISFGCSGIASGAIINYMCHAERQFRNVIRLGHTEGLVQVPLCKLPILVPALFLTNSIVPLCVRFMRLVLQSNKKINQSKNQTRLLPQLVPTTSATCRLVTGTTV